MKKITFVLAAMFAFATLGNAAETQETVYFGGAPSYAFKKFADINGPLPLSVTATADWNEVTLTDKASISTSDYKAIKVYYSDLTQVGDNKMQLVIGVKDPGYGQNNNWKLDPADFVDVDPAKESVELELGDKYDGKLIDKLTLALKKVGASITINKVVFVKQNGDEEIQSTSASGEVKQVTATPWFEFTKWNLQYLCDKTCTLLTYTKSAEESQKYVIEFAEPTKDKLQWLPMAVTADGVEVPAYIGIPVGSEKAELELNSEFKFTKDGAPIEWTSIKSIALQSDCADGVTQTVKIKSAKRIITNTTDKESLTIPSSSFATYAAYNPVNYGSLGLEAYAVKLDAVTKTIKLVKIDGVVPAGKAVLLKGIPGKSYELTLAQGAETQFETDLKASNGTSASTDAATLYALSTVDGVTAFYPVKKSSLIPAKRCYLEVVKKDASASNAAFYSLGTNFGETTGISSVENKVEKADAPVYNLAGQLVGKDYKGLVIKNGKKFVIK